MRDSYFSKDTRELFILLANNKVQYVIVGGEAVIYYGHARLTGDVDIFYDASKENAIRVYHALVEFWEGDIPGLEKVEELMEMGTILQFGVPPNRIDLINRIEGVDFREAWEKRTTTQFETEGGTVDIYFIGLDELIKNKEAMKRPKDVDDLQYLVKARKGRN